MLKGTHHTKKTRKKISKALDGQKRHPLSKETKKKISLANKSRWQSKTEEEKKNV